MKKLVITLILICTLTLTGCEKNRLVCTMENELIKARDKNPTGGEKSIRNMCIYDC